MDCILEENFMKLLIITQKVDKNDSVLGFFHRWIEEFAKHCDRVIVICLQEGIHSLPENVEVLSLGKEEGKSRLAYLLRFYSYIWKRRKEYDSIFVHMNQIYVILGGVLWRPWGKDVGLWYAHGHTSFMLRIAEKLTHLVFTSTQSGFRLKSRKLHIVGQGIDTETFTPSVGKKDSVFTIISVGRISPVKDYETLISAIQILREAGLSLRVHITGGIGLKEQEAYLKFLTEVVQENNLDEVVSFNGPLSNRDVIKQLQRADLFVNTSRTGSLDKAMLEAMSSGLPTLTSNEALFDTLGSLKNELTFSPGDSRALAERIEYIMAKTDTERHELGLSLRNLVISKHSLDRFVEKIIQAYVS